MFPIYKGYLYYYINYKDILFFNYTYSNNLYIKLIFKVYLCQKINCYLRHGFSSVPGPKM